MLTAFTTDDVLTALRSLGVEGAVHLDTDGEGKPVPYVTFEADGLKRLALLEACTTPKACLGLHLVTVWNDVGAVVDPAAVNRANASFDFGKGFIGPRGSLIYTRYTIADGGVTPANVRYNLTNYVSGTRVFTSFFTSNGSTVSAQGGVSEGGRVVRAALPASLQSHLEIAAQDGNTWSAPIAEKAVDDARHIGR